MNFRYTTQEVAQTLAFGEMVGARCRGGEVFELKSDLGGGKTTFTRGLAAGVGSSDEVSSPSFTLNNRYVGANLTIEHFDFYRLMDAGVMADELHEFVGRSDTVVVVEWGEVVYDVLPTDRIVIEIIAGMDDERTWSCTYDEAHAYLFDTETEANA